MVEKQWFGHHMMVGSFIILAQKSEFAEFAQLPFF
jgi:hypothetical protein